MPKMIVLFCFATLAITGCQGLGTGNYSANSITRVPAIGTGSYQVPGSYYGNNAMNQAGAQTMAQPAMMTAQQNSNIPAGAAPGSTMPRAGFIAGQASEAVSNPAVVSAGFSSENVAQPVVPAINNY